MDNAIQQIAKAVAGHLPTYQIIIIQIVVVIIGALIGSFFGGYLKTRGKHIATQADFKLLTEQLKANTELVEGVKTDFGQRYWTKREWAKFRRLKLESLIETLFECEVWIDRLRRRAIKGKSTFEGNPGLRLDALQLIYFPELAIQISNYLDLHSQAIIDWGQLAVKVGKTPDLAEQKNIVDSFNADRDESYQEKRWDAVDNLTKAVAELMRSIMGVEFNGFLP